MTAFRAAPLVDPDVAPERHFTSSSGEVRRLADARKAGMTEEELDAAIDVIAAVDAGVLQSLN